MQLDIWSYYFTNCILKAGRAATTPLLNITYFYGHILSPIMIKPVALPGFSNTHDFCKHLPRNYSSHYCSMTLLRTHINNVPLLNTTHPRHRIGSCTRLKKNSRKKTSSHFPFSRGYLTAALRNGAGAEFGRAAVVSLSPDLELNAPRVDSSPLTTNTIVKSFERIMRTNYVINI